jgi:Fe-S-cluster-containing hydrogenase component 2
MACPIEDAIIRDKRTGALIVTTKCDTERCNRECVAVCPYGAIHVDHKLNRAIKCDFCGGSPACVEACPWKVINYVEAGSQYVLKYKRISVVKGRCERGD